jgi:hypothetical protein
MSTTPERNNDRRLLEVETSGAAAEAFGGIAVVVLCVVALFGFEEWHLASIAGIVFGVAALAQGTAIATEYRDLYALLDQAGTGNVELGTGMTMEILVGGSAIALGALALIGTAPDILLPSLVIAGAASLILSAKSVQRLNNLQLPDTIRARSAHPTARTATLIVAIIQVLAGIGAGALGIVALTYLPTPKPEPAAGTTSLTFTLVGLLVLGCSIALSGSSLVGRFVQMLGDQNLKERTGSGDRQRMQSGQTGRTQQGQSDEGAQTDTTKNQD